MKINKKNINRNRSGKLFFGFLLLTALNACISFNYWSPLNRPTNDEIQGMQRLIRLYEVELKECHAQKNAPPEPTSEYENKRRRIRRNIQYLYQFAKFKMETIIKSGKMSVTDLQSILATIYEHQVSLLSDWNIMTQHDGFNEWRRNEANKLSGIIQKRFDYFMNPRNCSAAKYFKCHGEWLCGWGCQQSQYIACFSLAYGLNRKLIFDKSGQLYETDEYQRHYEPISRTCNDIPKVKEVEWPGDENSTILKNRIPLRETTQTTNRLKYMILDMPADLAPRMVKVFEEPTAWWLGEITRYILKPKNSTQKAINDTISKMGYKHPIVGIHIRRGNKIKEAKYQLVEDYMAEANNYFDQLELTQKVDKRRIYLATDEPKVIEEIRKNYPNYEVLVDESSVAEAGNYNTQKNLSSLEVLVTAWMLAMSDYFIGTLTSNLGRRVVEFRYWNRTDAVETIFSLDNRYFEWGEVRQRYKVVINHTPRFPNEIQAQVGDILEPGFGILEVLDQHGMMPVINKQKNIKGEIPSFKVEKLFLDVADFPTFGITD